MGQEQRDGGEMRDELYDVMKRKAYALASSVTGTSNTDAKAAGYEDLWDLLMTDSDHPRQSMFLMGLPHVLSEKQRRILLDGLAREYTDADGWLDYVRREAT